MLLFSFTLDGRVNSESLYLILICLSSFSRFIAPLIDAFECFVMLLRFKGKFQAILQFTWDLISQIQQNDVTLFS